MNFLEKNMKKMSLKIEDPYTPYDSFEELSCNEFVEWSISVVINQKSEVIDFSGDSKYYQESFMNKYPGIEL